MSARCTTGTSERVPLSHGSGVCSAIEVDFSISPGAVPPQTESFGRASPNFFGPGALANVDWIRKKASAILERVLRVGPRDSGIRRSLMKIIGCDFHPSFQQIAICDLETGEFQERKLRHAEGQAERFYRELGEPSLIRIEASGNSQWFLDLVERLGHEIRVGDAAKIRASYVRRQSTDKRDAGHILKLLLEKRFPQLWRPSAAMRDQRQLLRRRDKLVEIRTKVKNSLQHLAMNRGMQKKSRLWTRQGMEQFH